MRYINAEQTLWADGNSSGSISDQHFQDHVAEGGDVQAFVPSAPTAAEVKAEAGRRIEAIMPDYKQRNVLAFGLETVMTYGADPSQWPEPLQQVNAEMQAKWEAIKAIRVRSDEIEAVDPIPSDFRDDSYW